MQAVRSALRSSALQLQVRNAASTPASTAASTASKARPRRFKYPYTLAAMFDQFPFKMHYDNSWFIRWLIPGYIVTAIIFWKIQGLVNSPGNVAAFAERERIQKEKKHQH